MRITTTLMILSIALAPSASLAQGGHTHGHAKQGGVVTEVNDIDYELVARPEVIRLYVRDHDKPVPVTNASAKLTLLNGSEKSEVTLAPAGDKLEATGSFKVARGTKVVAVVTLPGKRAQSVRFEIK